MKKEYAQYSTEWKKPQEETKLKRERRVEKKIWRKKKEKKENKKEQIGKFIKTQECNVLTKYDISGFK